MAADKRKSLETGRGKRDLIAGRKCVGELCVATWVRTRLGRAREPESRASWGGRLVEICIRLDGLVIFIIVATSAKGKGGPQQKANFFTLLCIRMGERVPNLFNITSVFAVSNYLKFRDTVQYRPLQSAHVPESIHCCSLTFLYVPTSTACRLSELTIWVPARQNSVPTLNQVKLPHLMGHTSSKSLSPHTLLLKKFFPYHSIILKWSSTPTSFIRGELCWLLFHVQFTSWCLPTYGPQLAGKLIQHIFMI